MVILFSVPEARDQLLNKGVVYTFRWDRRAHFVKNKGPKEYTWANERRRGKKIADVIVEEIDKFWYDYAGNFLEPFVDESGFPNVDVWLHKLWRVTHPWNETSHGYVYRVTINSQQLRIKEGDK